MPGAPRVLGTQQRVRWRLYALLVHSPTAMDVKQVKQMNRQDKYKL